MPQTAHITFSVLSGYLVLLIKILLLQTTLLSQINSTLAVNIQNDNNSTAVRYSKINITQPSQESENSQIITKINTKNKQTSGFDETGATLKDGEKRLQLKRSDDVEIKNTNNGQLERTQNNRMEETQFSSKSTAEKKRIRQNRIRRGTKNRRQAYESTVMPTSLENYSDRETRSAETHDSSELTKQTSTSSSSGQNLLLRGDNKCSIYAKIEKCINYDQERTVCDWTVESPRCDGLMNYTLFYTKGSSNKGEVFTPYCVTPSGANGESEFKINSDKMDNNRNINNNRNTNNNRNANDNSDNNNKQKIDQNYRLFRKKKNKFWGNGKASPKNVGNHKKSSKNGQTSKNWAQSRSKNKQSPSKLNKNQKRKGIRKKSLSNSFKPIKPRSAVHDDIYFGEGSRRKKRAATGVQMAIYRGLENSARHRCTFRAEIGHVQHVFFVVRNLNDKQKIREPAADDLVFVVTGDENLVVTYPPINLHADAARGTVNLLWEKPNKIIYTFGLVPLLYRVKYRKKPNLNLLALGGETVADWSYQEVKSGETKHEMQDLERGYTYEFQVQATPKESEFSKIEWSESSNTDTAYVKGSGILETTDPARGGEKNTNPNYDTGTIIFPDDNEHLIARPTHMVVTLDQKSEEKLSVADVVWMSIFGVIASTFMIMLSYAINHREKLKRTLISRVPEPHILVRLGQDDRGLMPNSKKKKNKKRDSNNRRGTEQYSDSDSSGGNGGGAFLGGNGSIVQDSQGLLPSHSGMTIAHAVASPTQAAVNLMNSGSGANRRHLMIAEQLEQGLMHETNQRNQSQQTQQTTGISENRNLGTTMQLAGFGQGEQQWDAVRSPLIARESFRNEESIKSGDLRNEQPYALSDVSDIRSSKANSTIYSLANYDSGSGYPAIGNQDNSGGGVYPRIGTSTIIPGGNSGTTMPMTIPAALNPAANQSRYSSRAPSEHGNSRPISPFYRGQDFNDRPVSPGSSLVSSSVATSRRTHTERNMTFMRAELEENYNEMVFREFNEHQFGDQFRNSHFGDKNFSGDRNFTQDRNFGFHSKVYPSNSFNSSESNHSENFWRQAKAAISSDPNITRSSGYNETNSSASGRSRENSGARLIQSHIPFDKPLKTSFEEEHESNSSDSTTSYQPRESSSDSRESLDKISLDKKGVDNLVVIRSPRVKRVSSAGSVKSSSVKSASVKSANVKSASIKSASIKSAGIKSAGVKPSAKSSSLKQKSSLKSVLNKRNSETFSDKDFEMKSEYTTDENSTETETVQIIQQRIIVTERILVAQLVTDNNTDEENNLRPDGKESKEVCKRNDSWENESQDVLTPLPEECETHNFLQNSACYVASSSPSSSSPSPSSSNSSGSSSNNGSSSEDLSSSTKDSTAKSNLTISNSNSQKSSSSKNLKILSKNYQMPRRSRLNRKMSANSNNSSLSRQIHNSRVSAPLITNVTQLSSSSTSNPISNQNSQMHSTPRRVLSNRISNSSMDSGFAPDNLLSNRRSFTTRDNSGHIVCPPAPSSGARNEFQTNSEFNQHRTLMAQTSNTTDLGVINDVSSLNSSTEELRKKTTENNDSDSLKKPANVVTQSTRSRIGSFISRRIFGKK